MRETPPLEELEEFSLDGVLYEAFNTSGGLGHALRDPGRQGAQLSTTVPSATRVTPTIMKALLNDLRLRDRRELLKDIPGELGAGHAAGRGHRVRDRQLASATDSSCRKRTRTRFTPLPSAGRVRSAIQLTTAGAICAVLDMLATGTLKQNGLIRQEEIALKDFLANRFGKVFAQGEQAAANAA